LAWTIDYSDSAKKQLGKLDKSLAKRILDFMDERITPAEDPRQLGKTLRGTFGGLWRYRVADTRIICDIRDHVFIVLVVKVGHRREVYR
jgi:mRNA interferase RelE/StbE